MRQFHNIKITVFSKEDENEQGVHEGLLKLVPIDLENEKIHIKKTKATGFNEKKIIILEINLEKEKHINAVINNVLNKLDKHQKTKIIRQLESRLDEELNFFLRVDKEKLIKHNRLMLTDEGNCYHLKISAASYPKNRNEVLKKLIDIFKSDGKSAV